MRISWTLRNRRILEFQRISKILMNFRNWKITERMEIFDANVLLQLVIERKQRYNVNRANSGLLVHVCHKISIPNFKHKMQTWNLRSQSSKLRSWRRTEKNFNINEPKNGEKFVNFYEFWNGTPRILDLWSHSHGYNVQKITYSLDAWFLQVTLRAPSSYCHHRRGLVNINDFTHDQYNLPSFAV